MANQPVNNFTNVDIMDTSSSNIFTDNIELRVAMRDALTKSGVPEDPRIVRLLIELTGSIDDSLLQKVGLTLKAKALESGEADRALMIEVLNHLDVDRMNGGSEPIDVKALEITNEITDYIPVAGETETGHRQLSYTDVIDITESEEDDEEI